jgi:hypothetical protein
MRQRLAGGGAKGEKRQQSAHGSRDRAAHRQAEQEDDEEQDEIGHGGRARLYRGRRAAAAIVLAFRI